MTYGKSNLDCSCKMELSSQVNRLGMHANITRNTGPLLASVGVGISGAGWRLKEHMRLCLGLGFLEIDTDLSALGQTGQASTTSVFVSGRA